MATDNIAGPIVLVVLGLIPISLAGFYFSIPFLLKCFPSLICHGVFLNMLCTPRVSKLLSKPEHHFKLLRVNNHYITGGSNNKVGVWHMLPLNDTSETDEISDRVVLYCHGNGFHRGFGHRMNLYRLLRRMGFCVVTFDYIGYGDSVGRPSEQGAIEDVIAVYKWLLGKHPNASTVLVWGHSLGTSLAIQAVCKMQLESVNRLPDGLVLEAPFNSLHDVLETYPLSKILLKVYPTAWMQRLIHDALESQKIKLNSEEYLKHLTCSVLILHAEDDTRVHFKLGRKLFDSLKGPEACSLRSCTFVAFSKAHNFGHNGINRSTDLKNLIEDFLQIIYSDQVHQKLQDIVI